VGPRWTADLDLLLTTVFCTTDDLLPDRQARLGHLFPQLPLQPETVRRSALADAADHGWCASHSRYFWGFRLHAIFAPDGTPRALALTSPKADERDVALGLLALVALHLADELALQLRT